MIIAILLVKAISPPSKQSQWRLFKIIRLRARAKQYRSKPSKTLRFVWKFDQNFQDSSGTIKIRPEQPTKQYLLSVAVVPYHRSGSSVQFVPLSGSGVVATKTQ